MSQCATDGLIELEQTIAQPRVVALYNHVYTRSTGPQALKNLLLPCELTC